MPVLQSSFVPPLGDQLSGTAAPPTTLYGESGLRLYMARRGFGIHAGVVNGQALCRMFKQAARGVTPFPRYLSSDHDPLFRFHQWVANLRILNITEIETVPEVPWSHPFIERLIGTIRRECLDRLLFWTAADLELKLGSFRDYYNEHRTHSAREGRTTIENPGSKGALLKSYRWQSHCRGLYQTPIAA